MSAMLLNKVLYCEIDVLGIIFTLIILTKSISINNFKSSSNDQKVFICMLINMVVLFFFDGVAWTLDGLVFEGSRSIYLICLALYFSLNPMICFLWSVYINTKLYNSTDYIKKRAYLYSIPLVLNTLICFISIFTEWIFYVDDSGQYHRGTFYAVNLMTSFLYYIISTSIILRERHRNENVKSNKDFNYLVLFPLPPLVGLVIQGIFYGISVVYISVLMSFFIIFVNVQNKQIYTDTTTGIYNRRYLNVYLTDKLANFKRTGVLGVILIDLDYFKNLNDTYGHTVGDMALKDVARILESSLNANTDCISRFGGDEFVVSLIRDKEEEIRKEIKNIKHQLRQFNGSGKRKYNLSFSLGYAIYDGSESMDIDKLLKRADMNMYADKEINHGMLNG